MLWIIVLEIVCSMLPLRLKDLPLTLPLDSLFACSGSDRGEMIAWEIHCIISILRYRVPVARRPRMSDWGELASSLDALLLDHAPDLQEPLTYLFDALTAGCISVERCGRLRA